MVLLWEIAEFSSVADCFFAGRGVCRICRSGGKGARDGVVGNL